MLGFPGFLGIVRDGLGVYNEYTLGKGLRQNIGAINLLIPAFKEALGAHHASAIVSSYALPTGVAMLGIIALQGQAASEKLGRIHDTIDARTALASADEFAKHVWKFLYQRIEDSSRKGQHWFFVYHPDTNWYPSFHARCANGRGFNRLIAISHSLPHLCYFMMHIRMCLKENGSHEGIVFHLLMPAYRRMFIEEELIFNHGLYPLVLEGHVYDTTPFVTLRVINKEEDHAFKMRGITNLHLDEAGSMWRWWKQFTSQMRILELGSYDHDEDEDEDDETLFDSDSSEHSASKRKPANMHARRPSTRQKGKKSTQELQIVAKGGHVSLRAHHRRNIGA